jgi:hypothetical protein
MESLQLAANPFALMMNPAAVIAAMEGSARLTGLNSRVCRPLDKPLIGRRRDDLAAFDEAVDSAPDLDA